MLPVFKLRSYPISRGIRSAELNFRILMPVHIYIMYPSRLINYNILFLLMTLYSLKNKLFMFKLECNQFLNKVNEPLVPCTLLNVAFNIQHVRSTKGCHFSDTRILWNQTSFIYKAYLYQSVDCVGLLNSVLQCLCYTVACKDSDSSMLV